MIFNQLSLFSIFNKDIYLMFGCHEFGLMDLDLRAQIQNLCLSNLKEIDLNLAQIQPEFDNPNL